MVWLPWELVEEILSWLSLKSLARFRTVCKRLNALCKDERFANNHLARACRPQFILFFESKTCSVEVNLTDVPSIEVHKLPLDIPGYRRSMSFTAGYCDGLLLCATVHGVAVCNPWLKQTKWDHHDFYGHPSFCGIGYDTNRSDNHHKIIVSDQINATVFAWITEFGSDAWKVCNFESENWRLVSEHGVSLNRNLYWIARYRKSGEFFIQSFEFSVEKFKPLCILPGDNCVNAVYNRKSISVYRGDRFSFLDQSYVNRRNIDIWVTKRKINHEEGVVWMKFMNVSVPEWSCLTFGCVLYDEPSSYFIDDESRSLVMCYRDDNGEAYIYIAKGDRFYDIKIDSQFEYKPRHRTYFPSLVQVPFYQKEGEEIQVPSYRKEGLESQVPSY